MKRVTPYYLLNQRRLARIAGELRPMIEDIVRRWWPRTVEVLIHVKEYANTNGAATAKDQTIRHAYQCADQHLLFMGTDKQWTLAASEWLGCNVDQPSPLTNELESQYCQELASSIGSDARHSSCGDSEDIQAVLTSYLRPGAGAVAIEITVNGFTQILLTTADLFPCVDEHEDTVNNINLVSVADALSESKVTLKAYLTPSKLPLMDIAALAPGDFLNLKHDLRGEIFLIGNNSSVLIKAELGQRGNNKAALIIAENGN